MGCRNFLQLIRKEIEWGTPKTICSDFDEIHRCFVVISSLQTNFQACDQRTLPTDTVLLATNFRDCQWIIFIDYFLTKGQIISDAHNTSFIFRWQKNSSLLQKSNNSFLRSCGRKIYEGTVRTSLASPLRSRFRSPDFVTVSQYEKTADG